MDYPLRFRPLLRDYLWGGRRLAELGKELPPGDHWAESWEVCDRDQDQSVVLAGECEGQTLGQLVRQRGEELLGRHAPQARFPLLFKFLDAQKKLSVQVHPDDARAAKLDPPDYGKTEAWVVLDAEPGATLYVGLKRGVDRQMLARETARGTADLCLNQIQPRPGDCVFLPAGVCHAIGEGLTIAECQQSSDVTYRLFDWNRVGPDGRPRPLHVEQALESIDFDYGPGAPQEPRPTSREGVERLVDCDKFVWDRWRFSDERPIGGDGRFHLLAVIEGEASLENDPLERPLSRGSTCLIPASAPALALRPHGAVTLLDAYLP